MDSVIGIFAIALVVLQIFMQGLLVVTIKQHHQDEYYRIDVPVPFTASSANGRLTIKILLGKFKKNAPQEVLPLYQLNRFLLLSGICLGVIYFVI